MGLSIYFFLIFKIIILITNGIIPKKYIDLSVTVNALNKPNTKKYLFHILLVFPLFTLFGCLNRHFHLLGYDVCWLLGLSVLIYHGLSLVKSELSGNWNWSLSDALDFNLKPDKRNASRLRTVYMFHVLVIAPLLLYIGTHNKKNVDPRALGAVCSLGVLALFYNGYSYWRSETTGQWNWGY